MTKKKLLIIGAGGHAKVVAETVLLQSEYTIVGFVDDSIALGTTIINNYSVVSDIINIDNIIFDEFVVAIGNNTIRKNIFESLKNRHKAATIFHKNAVISSFSKISAGTVILACAIISFGVEIGENCIINAMTLIDHESTIAANCHIAQGVIIGSNCSIQELSNIALGSKIQSHTKL
jgi:sugar O-acyltransferase (sialic acid O-acetyltransferase NeuD family)